MDPRPEDDVCPPPEAELLDPPDVGITPRPDDAKRAFILEGNVLAAVLRLSWPLWIAVTLQDAYSLVDLFWVGKLGKDPVAAVALCGILMGMVFTVAIGLSTGVVAMVARFTGAGDREKAWAVAWQALYMGLLFGLMSTALGLPLAGPALDLLGAQGKVLQFGTEYLQIMAVGAATIFVVFAMNSALRGAGDTLTPMIAMALGTVVNIALDPLLIFGWWGFPALGVAGSALATVVAQSTGLVLVLGVLFSGRAVIRLHVRNGRPDPGLCWRIVRIGIFGSMQMWIRNVSSLFVIRIVTPFGSSVLAAFGIAMRLMLVFLLPGFGVGNAAATVVGQNLGAGHKDRAHRGGWAAAAIYVLISVVCGAFFFAFAPAIVSLFNDHPQVIAHGAIILRLLAASFPMTALGVVLGRSMAGAGDTISPMRITALALLGVQVPAAYVLAWHLGPLGIWIALSGANAVNGLLMAVWFQRRRWAEKTV